MDKNIIIGIVVVIFLIIVFLLIFQKNKYKRAIKLMVALLSEEELKVLDELEKVVDLRKHLINGPLRDYNHAKREIVKDISKEQKKLDKEINSQIKKLDQDKDKTLIKDLEKDLSRKTVDLNYKQEDLLSKLDNRYQNELDYINQTKQFDNDVIFLIKLIKLAKNSEYQIPKYNN